MLISYAEKTGKDKEKKLDVVLDYSARGNIVAATANTTTTTNHHHQSHVIFLGHNTSYNHNDNTALAAEIAQYQFETEEMYVK